MIVSSGAIASPQLLQRSGIGPGQWLKDAGVTEILDLPGVGNNLQDHLELYMQYECKLPVSIAPANKWWNKPAIGAEWLFNGTGLGASNQFEGGGFIRTDEKFTHPNIQYHFLPSTVNDHGRKNGDQHAFQAHVGPLRPTSRGAVTLKSKNPRQHPNIQFNYLTTPEDRQEFRECIVLTREIFAQKAFDDFRGRELSPGVNVQSDEEMDAFSRRMGDTVYHPSCTCKMGAADDAMAVVDRDARVWGVEGLRVVDASIMPNVVSGNLNGPTIMLAEKAADIIRGRPPLPKSTAPVWKPQDPTKQRGL